MNQIKILFIILLISAGSIQAGEVLDVGPFSLSDVNSNALPENWEPLTFKNIDKHTQYTLVKEDGVSVIKAESHAAASGLIRKIRIDPEKYPIIQWRWKITQIFKKGDVTQKSGDDYPVRIYIAFEYNPDRVGLFEKAKFAAVKALYGEYPPVSAINYIWGSNAPQNTQIANPYTDRVMMIVVETGINRANTWVTEERNIYDDYKAAFGETPPMISGVAIMTDSDNTGESAVSYFGDIVFKSKDK